MTDFNDTPETPAEVSVEVEAIVEAEVVAEEAPAVEVEAVEVVEEAKVVKKAKAPKVAAASTKTYKRGDAGRDIKSVQEYLVAAGIACPSTGIFCAYTHEAVKKFQASVGSEPTGIVGNEILSLI